MIAWDWKYRIFFDKEIHRELNQKKSALTVSELEIFNDELRFYLSFYSFGILFDLIVENPLKAEEYIETALNNRDKIIKTPSVLVRYYSEKLNGLDVTTLLKKKLFWLLRCSSDGPEILPEFWKYIGSLFGSDYDDIILQFTRSDYYGRRVRLPMQKIIKSECKELFDEIYGKLINDKALSDMYGISMIRDYSVRIIEGIGYGEWWDHEISSSGIDELILYTNDRRVKGDDYLYTIIHETYPGHGHFYASVRNDKLLFDHGAMMLIEGWATFCEWNTYPSKYIDAIKHNALATLYNSYFKDSNAIADTIRTENCNRHVPQKVYIKKIINQTQYIGFVECYYLGALWIEHAVKEGRYTPKSFLEMLRDRNKGEFFRLWK